MSYIFGGERASEFSCLFVQVQTEHSRALTCEYRINIDFIPLVVFLSHNWQIGFKELSTFHPGFPIKSELSMF